MQISRPRVLVGWLTALFLLASGPGWARPPSAAIVMDADTGAVLYAEGADRRIYPASLTKMMTLYMVFEALESGRLGLRERIRISRRAAGMPPSRLGLRPGRSLTVEQAILALVTKSANDVAVALAERLAGTEWRFAKRMTSKARALGMRRTTFRNASGLPDSRQRTTVRDMAILARALVRDHPRYYRYFSRRSFSFKGRRYPNHNRLLGRYAGLDGVKTGYIRASGFNLAASAVRGGRRVIAVVAGGRSARARDRRVARLLDLGFERLDRRLVARAPIPRPRPGGVALAAFAKAAPMNDDLAYPVPQMKRRGPLLRSSAAAVAARGPRMVERLYGVQVGAFLRANQARKIAYRARKLAPDILLDANVTVSKRRGRDRTFYRARIVGLTLAEARQACRILKSRRQDCLVVTLERPVRVAVR